MPISTTQPLFERWAELYDAIYAHRGKDYAAEAAVIVRITRANRPRGLTQSLLDVACGTGEHLRHLREHFLGMGVDVSEAMLAVAQRKLPGVRFVRADMTAIRLNRRFDVVTCLFASLGYLPDETAARQAIRCMAGHLEPNGMLIIEPPLAPEQLQPAQTSTMELECGDARVRRTTSARHEGNVLRIRFDYEIDRAGTIEQFTEEQPIHLYPAAFYQAAFRDAGLLVEYDPHGLSGSGLYIGRRG